MTVKHTALQILLAMVALALVAGRAQALTLHNPKGQGLNAIYGTYAPSGDCKREPPITVDDSHFTCHYRGHSNHPATFEYAVSCMGQNYMPRKAPRHSSSEDLRPTTAAREASWISSRHTPLRIGDVGDPLDRRDDLSVATALNVATGIYGPTAIGDLPR